MSKSDPADLAAGRLSACPPSPNCVSSQALRDAQQVEPLRCRGDAAQVLDRLRRAIVSLPGATILRAEGRYLHAEFRSPLLRFVDDLEALVDPERGVVELRSASRLGYWDLGANRRRVEALRRSFEATGAGP